MRKQEIIRCTKSEKSVNHGGHCLNLNVHLALCLTLILEINSFIMNTMKPYSVRNRNWFLCSSRFGNRSTVLCTNGMAAHMYRNMWKVSSSSYSCQKQRWEYAGPRADHDRAGPEYRYLDWYATTNTDYVDYGTKDIQVLHYGIWPWKRIFFKRSMYQHFQFTGEYTLTNS